MSARAVLPHPRSHVISAPRVAFALTMILLALPLARENSLTAQEGVGSIEGLVFDSTRVEPLIGADVILWNTSHRTRSGGGGVFRFNAIPAGTYTLNFFHPRLEELGVSAGSWEVVVEAGGETFLTLTTPSMPNILINQCLLEDPTGENGRVLGRIADRNRGSYVPAAAVTLSWSGIPGRDESSDERQTTTDSGGWFRFCDAPPDIPLGLIARAPGGDSPRREVAVSAGSAAIVPLDIGELTPASLAGAVRDTEGNSPIEGATVRLLGSDHRTFSTPGGDFQLSGVHPGEYTLVVEHLAYRTRVEGIMIGSGSSHSVDVSMATGAVELDPLTVTVDAGGIERALAMGGDVIPAEKIEEVRHRARDLGDLMMLLNQGGIFVRRNESDVCVGFLVGQAQMNPGTCAAAVIYVDNIRMVDPWIAMTLPAEMVDRIILFRPVDAGVLFTLGSGNGVIMIFTRQGRTN